MGVLVDSLPSFAEQVVGKTNQPLSHGGRVGHTTAVEDWMSEESKDVGT